MTGTAVRLDRLDAAVRQAAASGKIGTPRSLRFHVGGPNALPAHDHLLSLGDALFQCGRAREVASGSAALCVWERGQIATVSVAPAPRHVIVLTVLGSLGSIQFSEQDP